MIDKSSSHAPSKQYTFISGKFLLLKMCLKSSVMTKGSLVCDEKNDSEIEACRNLDRIVSVPPQQYG